LSGIIGQLAAGYHHRYAASCGKEMRKQIRISPKQLDSLESLAAELGISGQRGAWFQPFILHIATIAEFAQAETVAALKIATGCAAGEDWHDLIDAIEPNWPDEPK